MPPTLGVTKILAFGDSMTEGIDSIPITPPSARWTLSVDAGRSQSYPFKLQALINERYTAQTINVFNAGFGGKNARDDRGRFSQELSANKPELVLLLEGANDLNSPRLPGEGDNARIRATIDALEDMIREATARNLTVMIGTLPPARPGGKMTNPELVPIYNDALRTMANKKGALIVEFSTLPLSLIGVDGLHPTEEGYQRMAEIWLDAIKAKYEKPPQEIR